MKQKKKSRLSLWILIGLGLGIGVGLGLRALGAAETAEIFIRPFGALFLNLIKMLVVPLVFSSIVVGTCGLGDARQVGRVGAKTVLFYLVTTAAAVTLGLAAGNLFPLGRGLNLTAPAGQAPAEAVSPVDTLLNIIPSNPVAALAEGNMLQIIFFAIALGGAAILIGEKREPLVRVCESLAQAMYALTGAVMKLAPFAVFALIAPVAAAYGGDVLLPLAGVVLAVYGACALHMLAVYSAAVGGLGGMSPLRFFREAGGAILFAFSSASSAATLPLSMETAERLGVPQGVRSFVLPLGSTINMDGTAIYQGVCVLFIANAYGVPLDFGAQLAVILTCTLSSIGTAGVPGAGTLMLSMVLQSAGLPLEGVGLVWGVDRILDMARTAVNITGDLACAVVVGRPPRARQ